MGVCFIGEFDINDFLKKYIKTKKGKIITTGGEVVGEHEGVQFYTIGQRHGIGEARLRSSELRRGESGTPYYIVEKRIKENVLVVANKAEEEKHYKKEVWLGYTNWISGKLPDTKKSYRARVRYRQPLQNCKLVAEGGKLKAVFSKPQRAITAGQSLVLYAGKTMLGGGIINHTEI
jgi:tRNA-specific 2-thiouridylase